MATVQIYHEEDGRTSSISITLASAIVSDMDMVRDSYLLISTGIRKLDGSGFPTFLVRSLSDTAPGAGVATDFTDLVNGYVDYFVNEAEFGQSSSSSSSSTSESSSSSENFSESSSSSEGNSVSSQSESSSSSEGNSNSSSSSENYSESSSSENYSESSSSEGNSESSSSENYSESSSSS